MLQIYPSKLGGIEQSLEQLGDDIRASVVQGSISIDLFSSGSFPRQSKG